MCNDMFNSIRKLHVVRVKSLLLFAFWLKKQQQLWWWQQQQQRKLMPLCIAAEN